MVEFGLNDSIPALPEMPESVFFPVLAGFCRRTLIFAQPARNFTGIFFLTLMVFSSILAKFFLGFLGVSEFSFFLKPP